MHNKSSEVCINTRLTPASLPFRVQVTAPTTVKWSIAINIIIAHSYYTMNNLVTGKFSLKLRVSLS